MAAPSFTIHNRNRETSLVSEDLSCREQEQSTDSSGTACVPSRKFEEEISFLRQFMADRGRTALYFKQSTDVLRLMRNNAQLWSNELLNIADIDASGQITWRDFGLADGEPDSWKILNPDQVVEFFERYYFSASQEFSGVDDLIKIIRSNGPVLRSSYTVDVRLQAIEKEKNAVLELMKESEDASELNARYIELIRQETQITAKSLEIQKNFSIKVLEQVFKNTSLSTSDKIKLIAVCLESSGELFGESEIKLVDDCFSYLSLVIKDGSSYCLEERCLALNSLFLIQRNISSVGILAKAQRFAEIGVLDLHNKSGFVPDEILLFYSDNGRLSDAFLRMNQGLVIDILQKINAENSPGRSKLGLSNENYTKYADTYNLTLRNEISECLSNRLFPQLEKLAMSSDVSLALSGSIKVGFSYQDLLELVLDLSYLIGRDSTVTNYDRFIAARNLLKFTNLFADHVSYDYRKKQYQAILEALVSLDPNTASLDAARALIQAGIVTDDAIAVLMHQSTSLDDLEAIEHRYGREGAREYLEALLEHGHALELQESMGEEHSVSLQNVCELYLDEYAGDPESLINVLGDPAVQSAFSVSNLLDVAGFLEDNFETEESLQISKSMRSRAEETMKDWHEP